jgi:uncharacterized surface protein with fasciclin (FAS1) repeats
MRKLKYLLAATLGLAVAAPVMVPAQRAEAWPAPTQSITEIVAGSGGTFDNNRYDYDILLNAVLAADLDGALADPTKKLTVFAPNDQAFMRTARDLGFTGSGEQATWDFLVAALTDIGGGDPIPVLTNILLYHVAPKDLNPFKVVFSRKIPTLLGPTIGVYGISLIDKEPDLRNPLLNLGQLNIKATNGRIHGITRVLLPVNL